MRKSIRVSIYFFQSTGLTRSPIIWKEIEPNQTLAASVSSVLSIILSATCDDNVYNLSRFCEQMRISALSLRVSFSARFHPIQ